MRTIIAGSRNIVNPSIVQSAILESGIEITAVVCGEARGVDTLGKAWSITNNIPVHSFPAQWSVYGKRAGYIRNAQMADNADALIAVWDGKSNGTRSMIQLAQSKGLKVYIHMVDKEW